MRTQRATARPMSLPLTEASATPALVEPVEETIDRMPAT